MAILIVAVFPSRLSRYKAARRGEERRARRLVGGLDTVPGNIAYVWHAALRAGIIEKSLRETGFSIKAQIVWAKERLVIGRGDYQWMHEPCWYAVRKK